jgi:hypothetical protein
MKPQRKNSTFASPHEPTLKPKACKRAVYSQALAVTMIFCIFKIFWQNDKL